MIGDGIYDKLSNYEIIKILWNYKPNTDYKNLHEFLSKTTSNLMKEAMVKKTLDNITVVLISFKHLKHILFPKKNKPENNNNKTSNNNNNNNNNNTNNND